MTEPTITEDLIAAHGLSPDENHRAAAQAWLDKHNPGNVVKPPGLGFDSDYFWTWVPTGGEA